MGHFYFVRHGQTVWNVENKICGATDIALTEQGHEQAIETGKKILAEGIQADEILYSPLQRAADTAKHISEITGIPARVEPRLKEQNFGKWESTPRNGVDFKLAKQSFACSYEGVDSHFPKFCSFNLGSTRAGIPVISEICFAVSAAL
jgi:probable phosphoglycerate mutase